MLIDNKTVKLGIKTVWDFINYYSGKDSGKKGKLDIVTGYFTIHTLSKLYDEIPEDDEYRIISSEMVGEDYKKDFIVNLLSDDMDISSMGNLDTYAKKAIAFLERPNVQMRAVMPEFCHAKAYLFKDNATIANCFYVTGSSNLTPSGIGLKESANIELNLAEVANEGNLVFADLHKWYEDLWKKARIEVPEDFNDKNSPKMPVKEYFIRKIKEYFRIYTPEEIYYKILFELFNADMNYEDGIEHHKDMSLLQTSEIWKTLFNYQQKGVISLIKMLRKYNGAILADAVGLGKTFSALAVIKYFQTQSYTTVVFCPKKLGQNWIQYLRGSQSRFEKDEFDYQVRFHSDLQNDRLQHTYNRYKLDYIQTRKKVLVVIDESHNLRNEKSSRYDELLKKILQNIPGQEERDVKVLMLSATPINTGLKDVKGQFGLIAHGIDYAFNNSEFEVESLTNTFKDAQAKYTRWCEQPDRTIGGFIKMLPQRFFNLTDKLIVARTRKLIENTLGEDLKFPEREKPVNIYQCVDHFGKYRTTEEIYSAFDNLNLTAYQPSLFLEKSQAKARKEAASDWDDDVNRERFLVKMMGILFMKRLESSWFSCKSTVKKVLDVHSETLQKVINYKENGIDDIIRNGIDIEDEDFDLEERVRVEIKVSHIKNLGGFEKGLRHDVKLLTEIYDNICIFEQGYREGKTEDKDLKLEELIKILNNKKSANNKKIVIFTVYTDTAEFIYNELVARGFKRIACATGDTILSTGNHSKRNFTEILQSFAPYSKLYNELDWTGLYNDAELDPAKYYDDEKQRWIVDYNKWVELIKKYRPHYEALLNDGIDILIATDCLSEGQNLQDADTQVNYDIHWNPVRLIQRFGRIDRIGSPNEKIKCINFWPAQSFEDYLKLEERIQNRMAIMNLVGAETQELNDDYIKMVKDNPIQDKNAIRLLEELTKNSISDIESPQTLSLTDFSFETYRQDLYDFMEKDEEFYKKMPNGIFSGFNNASITYPDMPESLVALVGYPKKPDGKKEYQYEELYLMCQPVDAEPDFQEINKAEVLEFLRQNKNEHYSIPSWIVDKDDERINRLSEVLKAWMQKKAPQQALNNLKDKLKRKKISSPVSNKKTELLENKFQLKNFDLIVWEYVSNNHP